MRLTVVTPLFPPDVHDVASYHKDLITRLGTEHTVTVALFGHLPEQVHNVLFITIDKRAGTLTRLWQMFRALLSVRKTTDWFIVTNGPSTELAALALSFFTTKPILLLSSDTITHTGLYASIHSWLRYRAQGTVTLTGAFGQLLRPEIHPLIPQPAQTEIRYEAAWTNHIATINKYLTHGTRH